MESWGVRLTWLDCNLLYTTLEFGPGFNSVSFNMLNLGETLLFSDPKTTITLEYYN